MQYFTVAEAASNVWPFGGAISAYVYPCSLQVEVINVWEGEKFLDVSSWSFVTECIVVLIVRLLLVCSDDMGGLEYVHCTILLLLLL